MSSTIQVDLTLTENEDVDLKDASEDRVSRWVVEGTWSGTTLSVQPQGRVIGSDQSYQNISYHNFVSGAEATAALSGTFLILIDSSGLDVRLDIDITGGTLELHAKPLIG